MNIEPIYVHRETYQTCHALIVADLIIHQHYDLMTARIAADQTLMPLRYVSNDRLTEHEAA